MLFWTEPIAGKTLARAKRREPFAMMLTSLPNLLTLSRIVAIPIFDTALFESTKRQGLPVFTVVNILGFFIDEMDGNDVVGYLTEVPGLTVGAAPALDPRAAFLWNIQLIR